MTDQPQLPPEPPPPPELPPPAPEPPATPQGMPVQPPSPDRLQSEARTWAMVAHLAALSGLIIPFGHVLGPLIVWLVKKDQFPLVDDQGKESLNFQLSMTIYGVVAGILFIVAVGFVLLPVVVLTDLVFVIIAAVAANEGKLYRYPLTIRFLK